MKKDDRIYMSDYFHGTRNNCTAGIKEFLKYHGISYSKLRLEGIPIEIIEKIDHPTAQEVVMFVKHGRKTVGE